MMDQRGKVHLDLLVACLLGVHHAVTMFPARLLAERARGERRGGPDLVYFGSGALARTRAPQASDRRQRSRAARQW